MMDGIRKLMMCVAVLLAAMVATPAVFAQGFDFSEGGDDGGGDDGGDDGGDGFDFGGDGGDGGDSGGDGFDFGATGGNDTGDAAEEKRALEAIVMPDGSKPIIAAFFVPVEGEETPPADLRELADAVVEHMNQFEDFDAVHGLKIKMDLDAMSYDEREACVYDPACLARLGQELGVQKVVVGRLQMNDFDGQIRDRPLVSLDLTDVESGATENIIEFESHPRMRKRKKELEPIAYRLFNKEFVVLDPNKCIEDGGTKDCSEESGGIPPGQLWGAIGAGVAGLAFIGTGIAFGLSASGTMDDVNSRISAADISQREAQSMADDASSDALLANIMYGLGGVAIATGVILLLVRPGDEIAEDQMESKDAGAELDFFLQPQLGPEGGGFTGGVRW